MTGLEPRVQMDVAGKSTIFLLDTGVNYSVLTSFSGPVPSWESQASHSAGLLLYPSSMSGRDLDSPTDFYICLTVLAHSWGGSYYQNGMPLSLSLGGSHGPHPGDNLWETLGALVTNKDIKNPSGPDWLQQVNPLAWDQGIPGKAKNTTLVTVALKDTHTFPRKTQDPLRPEAHMGLQPIISKFLSYGLLTPTNSPYNTPILEVKKKDGTYHHSGLTRQ